MAFCTECGGEISANARFCTGCGRQVGETSPLSTQPQSLPPRATIGASTGAPGARLHFVAIVVVCMLLLVGGGAWLYDNVAPTPANAAVKFYRSVAEGRFEEAVPLVSPRVRGMLGDEKLKVALGEQAEGARARGGLSNIAVLKSEVQGEIAWVELEISFGNGGKERTRDKMERIEGKWVISGGKD